MHHTSNYMLYFIREYTAQHLQLRSMAFCGKDPIILLGQGLRN